jgi:protein TonB
MSFVQPQRRNTATYSFGVGIAIAFHALLIWALMSGLATKVVKAISEPIETKIIEEVKPPPPPPKVIEMPPPPKFTPPPPAYVPPPEVRVETPPPPQPTITTTSVEPPPPPPVAARAPETPPPPPAAPPAPPPAAPVSASVACSNYTTAMGETAFPREALRLGLSEGSTLIQFTLGPGGEVKEARAVKSTHAAFEKASIAVVRQFKCQGQGRDVQVQVPFVFKSE